jgi:tetratricopeptide (TPR) repeat protein
MMIYFANGILLLWLPIVLCIFGSRPAKQAVITAYIVAWLFLPTIGFNLPGLPDYTKMSATAIGTLLSVLIFDAGRLASFRPRLYDLPMLVWCLCPFFSSISSDLGAYEGASAVLAHLFAWGLPYLIGRLYLNDYRGIRLLALGMVVGALAYVPLCLIEVRLSPVLDRWVYGLSKWEGTKYGGWRPRVFMESGLETGMWMANATLIGYWLWASGAVGRVRGYSTGVLTLVLLGTTIACKSTGAGMLMLIGMVSLWLVKRTGKTWPVWLLLLFPPAYEITRTSGTWTGRDAVEYSKVLFGEERAQSLDFRMMNEDMLIERCMQRPMLGWGRSGGLQEVDRNGRVKQVVDGYWIITLGYFGIVGLTAMTTAWLLPLGLLIYRQRAESWSEPEVGAAAVLGVVLALYMTDNVSNAMPNPVYALAMGGLLGLPSTRRPRKKGLSAGRAVASGLVGEGRLAEAEALSRQSVGHASADPSPEGRLAMAEALFRRAVGHASGDPSPEGRQAMAEALEELGHALMINGRPEEAEPPLRDALDVRDSLAAEAPHPGRPLEQAVARERLARAVAEVGRTAEAIELRRDAIRIWDDLTAIHPADAEIRDRRVDALNDLAWLLATAPDPTLRHPARALALAQEAVRFSSGRNGCWNTLGVARYRAEDWPGAVQALERSAASAPGGGTAFDYFFLAMACRRLGDEDRARDWFYRAVAWARQHRPGHPALARFRDEAAALLGTQGEIKV